jgi:Domain of unknown function (DUF1857)
MKFEHLVEINDPLNPLIDPLTRNQLWRGLVRRAENPKEFVLALDACEITAHGDNTLARALTFGRLVIRDQVTLRPEHEVRHDIEASAEVPGGTLVVTIEEPDAGQLFVRFAYDTRAIEGGPPRDAYYDEYVKQAYVEADVDSIVTIRRLIVEGKL